MEDGTEKAIFDDAEILGNSIRDAVETFKKNHPGRRVELKNEHGSINLVCSHLILSLCFDGKKMELGPSVPLTEKLPDHIQKIIIDFLEKEGFLPVIKNEKQQSDSLDLFYKFISEIMPYLSENLLPDSLNPKNSTWVPD